MAIRKEVVKTKEQEAEYKKRYAKDHQMIKGRFTFKEVPGGTLVFSFFKYKGDKILRFSLKDGDTVELPYMVAKHLATNVYTDVYANQLDADGRQIHAAVSKIHRTAFERLDFDDDSFVPSRIIEVDTRLVTT